MSDSDEQSGVPRRHILGLLGGTAAATAASGWWSNPYLEGIWENRGESKNLVESNGSSRDSERIHTTVYSGTNENTTYEDWQEAFPEGCELPESYETAVKDEINEYDELDGDRLTDYVNTGRVQFRRGETEVYMLVDADGDGQYDDRGHSIPDVCG